MCESCKVNYIASSPAVAAENVELIANKKYEGAQDGLIYPSQLLQDVLSEIEEKYRNIIDEAIYSQSVKLFLVCTFEKLQILSNVHCDMCQFHKLLLHVL